MASSSIDSLIQITGPSRAPVDLVHPSNNDAEPFDDHFSRAAQSTASRDQPQPESASSPQDDTTAPDQRDTNSNSSLPDDSYIHEDLDKDPQAKAAGTALPDEPREEDLDSTNDEVEISGVAATQAASVQLSEAKPPFSPTTQSAEKESPAEETAHAATGVNVKAPETAAGQPAKTDGLQAATQPAGEESTEEDAAHAVTQPTDVNTQATGTSAGQPNTAEAHQAVTQDVPAELAAPEAVSSSQLDLRSTDDPTSGNQSTPERETKPTEHDDETDADAGISDKRLAKDRQAVQTSSLSPGKETPADTSRASNTESASPTRPTHAADTPVPLATDSTPSSGTADQTFDRLTAARSIQPALQTSEQPAVDRARFVGRVSRALRLAQQRDGRMQLRLSPPELGSLRMEISVQQGILTATMETETAAARHVLLENLPALRERLAGQEIRIERFDVDVRREGGEQSQNQAAQQRPNDQSQRRPGVPGRQTDEPNGPARGILPLASSFNKPATDGLDVVI
jgi:flagellar hook-length control protein FliK